MHRKAYEECIRQALGRQFPERSNPPKTAPSGIAVWRSAKNEKLKADYLPPSELFLEAGDDQVESELELRVAIHHRQTVVQLVDVGKIFVR